MQDDSYPELSDELDRFAMQLGLLKARAEIMPRDQIMYEAGLSAARAESRTESLSNRRAVLIWRSAALVLLASSIGLGFSRIHRPDPPDPSSIAARQESPVETESLTSDFTESAVVSEKESEVRQSALKINTFDETSILGSHAVPAVTVLSSRRALVEQMMNGRSDSDEFPSRPVFTSVGNSEPVLSPRSLLLGNNSRSRLLQFVEELHR
jgi:hypothetical protein